MSLALERLAEERKQWRKDHPFGFLAKPVKGADGTRNMLSWECGVPGLAGTPWEDGLFKCRLDFSDDYPIMPPKCHFTPPIFHPNVFTNGAVCLSLLDPAKDWKPSVTLKQILLGLQQLLDNPNVLSPANGDAMVLYVKDRAAYDKRIHELAKRNKP